MFKLQPSPTFDATVQVTVPGGKSQPLRVTFKHKGTTPLADFLASAQGRSDAALLEEMIAQVDPAEKEPGQSDADFLAQLGEAYPAARSDILRTYLRELTESRVKN